MAPLPAAPSSFEDAGAPRFGSYEGGFDSIDLKALRGPFQPSTANQLLTRKKWVYAFVATKEVAATIAIVDVGYTSNAFSMAVDLVTGQVLVDSSFLGPPRPLVSVSDRPGAGLFASFPRPDARLSCSRPFGDERYHFAARVGLPFRPRLSLDFDLLAAGSSPPLTVVAPVDGGGVVNVTQKWAGMQAFGALEAKGRRYTLDGGVGGFDYTQGYLARHTAWRWAFGCGRLGDGATVGFNLVEGFNEARDDVNENAVWFDGKLWPVGRARFSWRKSDPLQPWAVDTTDGALSLRFKPLALHHERRDPKLVKSLFVQPLGLWEGTLSLGGRQLELKAVPGVAEDQDILW
jgi:hypothetical protein